MVSTEIEGGVPKCAAYWPLSEGDAGTRRFGNIEVTLARSEANEAYIIKGLEVVNTITRAKRTIWHLQYTAWPDHGVPESPTYFLAFLDELHNIRHRVCAGNTAVFPTVVHCSAGVGRTGVLILIEVALARLSQGLPVDLSAILKELRNQRVAMVQTLDQYRFCYETVIAVLQQQVGDQQPSSDNA